MNEREKIEEILHHFRMEQREFAEKCGFDPTIISNIKSGKTGISRRVFNKIISAFPDINKSWLSEGEGEMLKNTNYKSTVIGDNNTTLTGKGNQVNSDVLLELQKEYLEIIRENQRQLSESQLQISRLITIIEQMSKK